ncbi:MAG: guanylate kinase [Mogibacterium sp.]|nr:guanylate kinase [Mogibacterium sp.]
MSRKKGKLYVITGPSGTGKGCICKELLKDIRNVFSVSMTTREAREGETEGKDYFFVSREEFLDNIEKGNFLEYASVFDNLYGTPKDMVIRQIAKGYNVILDIDVQGALQVKKVMPEAILVFLLPPSLEELRRRLEGRATDSHEVIEKRLGQALNEIKLIGEYDYYVINDEIEKAATEVQSIMTAENCRVPDRATEIIKQYE